MKTSLFLLIIITGLAACKQKQTVDATIVGRWNTSFKNGSKVLAVFRADGTHDYFIDGKLFSNGKYSFANGTLSEADPICNGDYYATYRVNFTTANEMQFKVIQDTCKPRIHDLDGIKMIKE